MSEEHDATADHRSDQPANPVPAPDSVNQEFTQNGARDRQIVITGRSVSGYLLSLYLQQAGYDPLLVGPTPSDHRSLASDLWQSGAILLDRLGINEPIQENGRPLAPPAVYLPAQDSPDVSHRYEAPDCSTLPCLVNRDHIIEQLQTYVADDTVRPEWQVQGLTSHQDGIQVEFNTGVREWFDVVVDTTSHGRVDLELVDTTDEPTVPLIAQFECELRVEDASLDRQRLVITESGIGQLRPLPASNRALFRLSTDATPQAKPESIDAWRSTTPGLFSQDIPEFIQSSTILDTQYRSVRQASGPSGRWSLEPLVRCGQSAYPIAPAGSLDLAVAIENTWVLADELIHGPRSPNRAIQNYARRRQRRIRELIHRGRLVGDRSGFPTSAQPEPLATLTELQAVTVSTFHPDISTPFHTEIPEEL